MERTHDELGKKARHGHERHAEIATITESHVPGSTSGTRQSAPRGSRPRALQSFWFGGTCQRFVPKRCFLSLAGFITLGMIGESPVPQLLANSHPATAKASRLALEIGGLSMGLWCENGMSMALDKEHHPFIIPTHPTKACDLELDVSWANDLELPSTTPSFASGGLWSAFVGATGTKFYFSSPTLGVTPYKAAWFDPAFERGHIVLRHDCFAADQPVFPLEYPIDELAMMHRLSRGEGVELHALGLVDYDGSGYLFLGHSGAGKSTAARLWKSESGVKVLSDDRIILRKKDSQYWMYGTPWHGDAGVSSPGCAPLTAIFLLEQAPANQILPLPGAQATAELFARSFVPHYLSDGIRFTLIFFDELTRSIPCSVFRFAPTESAVEAIRHARA